MTVYGKFKESKSLEDVLLRIEYPLNKCDLQESVSFLTELLVSIYDVKKYHADASYFEYIVHEITANMVKYAESETIVSFQAYRVKHNLIRFTTTNFVTEKEKSIFMDYIKNWMIQDKTSEQVYLHGSDYEGRSRVGLFSLRKQYNVDIAIKFTENRVDIQIEVDLNKFKKKG